MITPEIATASLAGLIFALFFILTSLRLLSQEKVVFHSLLYMGLGLGISLAILMAQLEGLTPLPVETYRLIEQTGLLLLPLTFGALTLDFLKKEQKSLIKYWSGALLVVLLWGAFEFDFLGENEIAALLGPTGLNFAAADQIILAPLILSAGGWLVGLGTALLTIALDFRQPHPTQYLNRLRYWTIATTLLTASGLILFLSPPIFDVAGLVLLTSAGALAGYIVLSYNTPDLKQLMGRAARYSGVTIILFTLFFLSMTAVILITRTAVRSTAATFWAIILAFVLATTVYPLQRFSYRFLTRLIFGKQQKDEKQVIKHYNRSISSALDMNRLGDTIIDLMIETLGIEYGIVFVNHRNQAGHILLRPLSSVGLGMKLTPGDFETHSPFIHTFRQGKKIVSQYDIDVLPEFRQMAASEKAWLSQLNMELYLPILRERDLIGLLGVGQQGQKNSFYDEDRDLMIALADQAALAMDSARLFEQLAVINQEVGALTDKLAGLDQGKADFLSIASHELRTPLTHIHGYSRMLLDLTEEELRDPTYVKTIIEGIARGSERMKGVVDVMFDVTEADVGVMNLFMGEVILKDVLEMAARPFLTALDERRIAFARTGVETLPPIKADGTRLVQAMENLISNAVKYTPDGGLVTIEGRQVINETIGPAIEIVVIDSGIGIAPQYHHTIFEKFFRVDDTDHHSTGKTKFKGGGPGLGLTLVKAIAEAHGGKVWVESEGEDEANLPGSKFFFVIPFEQTNAAQSASQKQSQIETRHWHG